MAIALERRGDHAVLAFSGELTVPAVLDLVGVIDSLVDTYFYPRIELVISSSGGMVQSANPFFSALPRWRARGTVLCTRVYSTVASLAAILFSVGDERVADPHARLFFHGFRVFEAQEVTALDAVGMHSVLTQLDQRIVGLLVDRAVRGDWVALPASVDPSDGSAVSILLRELSGGRVRNSESARVRALAGYVRRAVRSRDRAALERLYSTVLRKELSVSRQLACTLCLADRILDSDPSHQRSGATCAASDPALLVPEWRVLYPPRGEVPRAALTRHTLVLGETGSGKTAGAVLPVLAAMARAPGQVAGGLVIDPKCELAPVVRAVAGDSPQHIESTSVVLDLMSGPQWRLDEALAAKQWVTAAVDILFRMRGFALSSPLRVLGPHEPDTATEEFFDREACLLLRDVVAFILMLIHPDAPALSEWLCRDDTDAELRDEETQSEAPTGPDAVAVRMDSSGGSTASNPCDWVQALHARAHGSDGERGVNVVALAAWALGTPLVHAQDNSPWLWGELAKAAWPVFGVVSDQARDLLQRVRAHWAKSVCVSAQHMGVVGSARAAAYEFSQPSVAQTLYFGCEPGLAEGRGQGVDFARLVACGLPDTESPRFVLYQPVRDGSDSLVAAALKARFFESVFADKDRQTGRSDLPLLAYVADEAHRYITSDALHGEQSFLDSARSYGCCSVLATQSLASFEHALAQGGGTPLERRAALEIVWTNTGTKLVFRSSFAVMCSVGLA